MFDIVAFWLFSVVGGFVFGFGFVVYSLVMLVLWFSWYVSGWLSVNSVVIC